MQDKKSDNIFKEDCAEVNQDHSIRAAVNSSKEIWHESPCQGVERIYLERNDGGERATATSIVRFSPNSYFEEHTHDSMNMEPTQKVPTYVILMDQLTIPIAKMDALFL